MKEPICPQLHVWRQLYTVLEEAHQRAGVKGMPPPPPSYNMQAWELSSASHKRQRWEATKAWAAAYGFTHLLDELSSEDFYDGD